MSAPRKLRPDPALAASNQEALLGFLTERSAKLAEAATPAAPWTLLRSRLTYTTAGAWTLQTPWGRLALRRGEEGWQVTGSCFGPQAVELPFADSPDSTYLHTYLQAARRYAETDLGERLGRAATTPEQCAEAERLLGWARAAGLDQARAPTRAELVAIIRDAADRFPSPPERFAQQLRSAEDRSGQETGPGVLPREPRRWLRRLLAWLRST